MGKPSPPAAPDPNVTIPAQTKSNIDTATASSDLNHINQVSPYGSITYDQTGTQNIGGNNVPQYTQTTALSPEQQQLYNSQVGLEQQALGGAGTAMGNVQNTIASPFSLKGLPDLQTGASGGPLQNSYANVGPNFGIDKSNLPSVPVSANDFAAQGQQVQDAMMSRFNQDFPKEQEATTSRLNAQGIQQGSEGYGTAMDQLGRQQNDAKMQAVLAGRQEQNQLFNEAMQSRGQLFGENTAQANQYNQAAGQATGQNQAQAAFSNTAQGQLYSQLLQNANLQNQARQQSIGEQQLERSQPINEFATLLGLGGNVQTPTMQPNFGVNVGNTDVLGAYGLQSQAQQNAYNQQMGSYSDLLGGLLGGASQLGSAYLLKSDIRSKNIIRRVGETKTGVPLYLYTFKGSNKPVVGVVAQEVRNIRPFAVRDIRGALHVDYSMVA